MGIDILGKDIMGVDILGIDIVALPHDMHGSSEEFEIQPDRTTDCGVSCP